MLRLKSVASALVLVASAADVAVPLLVAPAVALAVSAAAHAEPARTLRQQAVRYDDLNLASLAGAAVFQARLNGALKAVCGPQADLRNFDEAADYKACVAKASQDALASLPHVQRQAARPSHAG